MPNELVFETPLGYIQRKMSGYNKGNCTAMFIAALFTITKLWKQPRCPTTDEWIKKYVTYIPWNFIQP
jgi:hypothetical protein